MVEASHLPSLRRAVRFQFAPGERRPSLLSCAAIALGLTPPLSTRDVGRILKALASRARLDPTHISSHSLRVGKAVDCVAANIDAASIMQAGGWTSVRMVARYTSKLGARRGAIAAVVCLLMSESFSARRDAKSVYTKPTGPLTSGIFSVKGSFTGMCQQTANLCSLLLIF